MEGTGKVDFARHFAQSLLCNQRSSLGYACGACSACGWFLQGNHPDFRQIRPEILDDQPADSVEGDGESGKLTKSTKAPSKEIKIDQVRALGSLINVSTHRQGQRVILLYPAESLNHASANALLKTLEEPPPETVFLLVTHRIDRLLPTILSRCRQISMPFPAREQALSWLSGQGAPNAEAWLAEQGGAPLTALALSSSETQAGLSDMLRECCQPNADNLLKVAEKIQKLPLDQTVACMQRWLYDVLSLKLSGRIRYYPAHRAALLKLAHIAEAKNLMSAMARMNDRRGVSDHPLSARLFIEDMLLDYAALFEGNSHG